MKKLRVCLSVLLVIMVCASCALAEPGDLLRVGKCEEFITLREEPNSQAAAVDQIPLGEPVDEIEQAENGFVFVSYRGRTGYALGKYLTAWDTYRGKVIKPDSKQRYNLNLFLSNFTEQGFLWRAGCYDIRWFGKERNTLGRGWAVQGTLTRFAIEHCWFNRKNRLEWGDYFDGNNVRLPQDQIAPIVEKYFGFKVKPSNVPYMDFRDGYYYWQETGGHVSNGFACLYNVESLGSGRYCVWFGIFAGGEAWTNDACYYSWQEAAKAYPPSGTVTLGRAVINTGSTGLEDRSGWSIERYTVNYD